MIRGAGCDGLEILIESLSGAVDIPGLEQHGSGGLVYGCCHGQ